MPNSGFPTHAAHARHASTGRLKRSVRYGDEKKQQKRNEIVLYLVDIIGAAYICLPSLAGDNLW